MGMCDYVTSSTTDCESCYTVIVDLQCYDMNLTNPRCIAAFYTSILEPHSQS